MGPEPPTTPPPPPPARKLDETQKGLTAPKGRPFGQLCDVMNRWAWERNSESKAGVGWFCLKLLLCWWWLTQQGVKWGPAHHTPSDKGEEQWKIQIIHRERLNNTARRLSHTGEKREFFEVFFLQHFNIGGQRESLFVADFVRWGGRGALGGSLTIIRG
jgi:hypothetical protein